MLLPLVKYVLLGALRDRFLLSFVILLCLGSSLSLFFGSAAVLEKQSFSLVFAASGLRLASVFTLVLFSVSFIRRAFENKDIEFLLSRPIGRLQIIASYAIAFAVLSFLMVCGVGVSIFALSGGLVSAGMMIWLVTLFFEIMMMSCIALFFAMFMSSPSAASFAVIGVYVLGRMMGQLLGIVDASPSGAVLAFVMNIISVFMPRLDLMAQSSWILYNDFKGDDVVFILMHGGVFTIMVVTAACIDFVKKQF